VTKNTFNELYEVYSPKVFRICKGYFGADEHLAHDVTQEIFIKVWENLDGFRGDASAGTWIYRIAVNTCLLHLRKSVTKREVVTDRIQTEADESDHLEKERQLASLYACIGKLDETSRMIVLMMLEGESYEVIASVMGVSEDTLRVRIHRIKKTLSNCVNNE